MTKSKRYDLASKQEAAATSRNASSMNRIHVRGSPCTYAHYRANSHNLHREFIVDIGLDPFLTLSVMNA
jgi:hypothetical protein